MLIGFVAAIVLVISTMVEAADRISGFARVLDGDTLDIGETRVRLEGIGAPESGQWCGNRACGAEATEYLRSLVAGREVRCDVVAIGDYGRAISQCWAGEANLGRAMIKAGFVMAFVRYSDTYVLEVCSLRGA